MKVVFVVEHFYPYVGGAETLFLSLTSALVDIGYDVSIVTTLHTDTLQKYEVYKGVKITRVRCKNRFLFTLLSLPEVYKQSKEAEFIHTTSYNSAIPSFLVGLLLRKKVIITFHEVWSKLWFRLPFYSKWKLTGFYLFEWFILKLSFHKYIAVSEFTKNALIENGIAAEKIVKIYNGLDYEALQEYRHQAPEKFTFCFFGRLGISKGIDLLLDATRKFTLRHPDSTLKLILPTYPASLFKKVLHLIKEFQLEDKIILMHNLPRADLLKEVSGSSCVIIPSISEGFCFVAVESVAMGIPIISSGKGSLKEVVSGKFITLNSLGSDSICESLEKVMNGIWETNIPQKFPLKESIDGYLRLYESIKMKETERTP